MEMGMGTAPAAGPGQVAVRVWGGRGSRVQAGERTWRLHPLPATVQLWATEHFSEPVLSCRNTGATAQPALIRPPGWGQASLHRVSAPKAPEAMTVPILQMVPQER
jgi:hypothetical protein